MLCAPAGSAPEVAGEFKSLSAYQAEFAAELNIKVAVAAPAAPAPAVEVAAVAAPEAAPEVSSE